MHNVETYRNLPYPLCDICDELMEVFQSKEEKNYFYCSDCDRYLEIGRQGYIWQYSLEKGEEIERCLDTYPKDELTQLS